MTTPSIEELAHRLDEAWENRTPLPPLSESAGLTRVEDAYAIQSYWSKLRLARGERIIGRKIGLTSKAIQQQLGVNEPDYGTLWASRHFPVEQGQAEVQTQLFLQPRLEGEIAFLVGQPLRGPGVTIQDVLTATEAVTSAFEIIDSRIADWRIKLVDTIADNASYGGVILGPWQPHLREADLRLLGMIIQQNGESMVEGIGAAALGHPAAAVAWLVNKLSTFDIGLKPGDIVLSGALGRALALKLGDIFTLEMFSLPPLTVKFT